MWGIIPAAGLGTRIQPLAFSKELLPVGSRFSQGAERPKAVSEYIVERMLTGGADKLCFVIAPGKSDIVAYHGSQLSGAQACFVVQERPVGLCDAVFRALPLIRDDESVLIGLPDTVWFPVHGYRSLNDGELALLLFPVEHPELFDAVLCNDRGLVRSIQVKQANPGSNWIWGAVKTTGRVLRELQALWVLRGRRDPYLGTLFGIYADRGGRVIGEKTGTSYVDVGTLDGYRQAMHLLGDQPPDELDESARRREKGALP